MDTLLTDAPPWVRLVVQVIAVQWVFLSACRLFFFFRFRRTAPRAAPAELVKAFWIGGKFDLRLTLFVVLPLLALALVPGLESPAAERIARIYLIAAWSLLVLIYLVDAAHYGYLHVRVNATALEHLEAPLIALRTGLESFAVVPGLLAGICLVLPYAWIIQGITLEPAVASQASSGVFRALSWVILAVFIAAGLHGRFARFPLRWSNAFFTSNPFVAALALNPVLFFVDTWNNRHAKAKAAEVRAHYAEVCRWLGVASPDPERLSFTRTVKPRSSPPVRPNLVFVLLESFASYKVGAFGNRLDPTPCFDRIAERSLLYKNFFAVTSPTARAVFTLITGIPDVNAVHAASRNPLAVRKQTIANAFRDYRKMYFIGGSASWGNIRGLLSHNIDGLRIFEQRDFHSPRTDGWGISDRHLFQEAGNIFRKGEGPFLAFIQTSGNHRPWTIPEDNGGFAVREVEEPVLRRQGFESLKEFNSFRFMDHSLGEFLEGSEKEPWFRDTIFFLFGDHGAGAPHDIPFERLGLTHVHTPLAIFGDRLPLRPRVIDSVMSSLDILPTAAGLAGIPYENATLGRDILNGAASGEHFAFIRRPPHFGLVGNRFFLSLEPDGATKLYPYREPNACEDVSVQHPEEAARMSGLCRGILETSRFLLYRSEAKQ